MNRLKAKGNLNLAKGKVKRVYAKVLEDPEREAEGEMTERVGRAQKAAGQALASVPKLLKRYRRARAAVSERQREARSSKLD